MEKDNPLHFRQEIMGKWHDFPGPYTLKTHPKRDILRELSMKNPIVHQCLMFHSVNGEMSLEEAIVTALEALVTQNDLLHKELVHERMMSTRPVIGRTYGP